MHTGFELGGSFPVFQVTIEEQQQFAIVIKSGSCRDSQFGNGAVKSAMWPWAEDQFVGPIGER